VSLVGTPLIVGATSASSSPPRLTDAAAGRLGIAITNGTASAIAISIAAAASYSAAAALGGRSPGTVTSPSSNASAALASELALARRHEWRALALPAPKRAGDSRLRVAARHRAALKWPRPPGGCVPGESDGDRGRAFLGKGGGFCSSIAITKPRRYYSNAIDRADWRSAGEGTKMKKPREFLNLSPLALHRALDPCHRRPFRQHHKRHRLRNRHLAVLCGDGQQPRCAPC
jgi:hypothetical protein